MRELLMEWMADLALFSLISSICVKLLPGKSYAPYVKLFSGVVLILLFLNPVLAFFELDEKIADQMEVRMFEMETSMMEQKLFEIEESQKEKLKEEYEKSIKEWQEEGNVE